MEALALTLPKAFQALKVGGVLAVISFHSLEDRMVKRFMRKMAGRPQHRWDRSVLNERRAYGEMLNTKIITPSKKEVEENPRSRSARLRVLRKLSGGKSLMVFQSKKINKFLMTMVFGLILFFGAGALCIVWLRMEISSVAKSCGELEGQMEIVGREVYELRGQRSQSLRPSSLAVMVAGRLAMPAALNTYHVSASDLDSRVGGW